MAQWLGQFSGKTHATAIADAEQLLVQAIAAYRAATDETRAKKAKAVRGLAKRLLTARRRPLRARLEDDKSLYGCSKRSNEAELQRLDEGGIAAILAEFGCVEALTSAHAKQ